MNKPFPNSMVFDLDGTLIDSFEDVRAALNRVLAEDGYPPLSALDVRAAIGKGLEAMVGKVMELSNCQQDKEYADRFAQRYLSAYAAEPILHTYIYPGVMDALEEILSRGTRIGICTNKPGSSTRQILTALKIDRYFRVVVTPDECIHRKPDGRHILQTLDMMGVSKIGSLMIGDSESDIMAAKDAAIPSIAVTYGYCQRPVERLGADMLIDGFDQLVGAAQDLFAANGRES